MNEKYWNTSAASRNPDGNCYQRLPERESYKEYRRNEDGTTDRRDVHRWNAMYNFGEWHRVEFRNHAWQPLEN